MRRAAAIVALLTASVGLAAPPPVSAHPFGPFSISVYGGLVVHDDHIQLRWVLDMAETAAVATVDLIDADDDGRVTDAEKAEYFDLWVGSILEGITLVVHGQELLLSIVDRELTLPKGEGGVPAVRLVMDLTAEVVTGASTYVATYRDTNYTDYYGWREVAVAPAPGIRLLASTAPAEGRTKELTEYPADLGLSVPTSEAEFTFAAEEAAPAGQTTPLAASENQSPSDSAWPTGIFAALVGVAFIGVLVALNKPPGARRDGPRARRRR